MNGRHPDLDAWIEGEVPPGERHCIAAHLSGCLDCRRRVAQRDPALLFRVLACEEIPEGVLERVSARATAAIAREVESQSGRRWASWAAVAASFLLAFWFGAYLWDRPVGGAGSPVAPGSARSERTEHAGTTLPASMFEVLETPGVADVFEFSIDGDVQVAMIFDTELEI